MDREGSGEVISIPSGTIKRFFFFYMCNLRPTFQFLLVRLKDDLQAVVAHALSQFQFLLVRLKEGKKTTNLYQRSLISIPSGTIKRNLRK